jgi:ribosome-binding protein aMBF1 (putative translation factor)
MPNFATALKEEIRRLARREIKTQVAPTRQAIVQYRHEIARLKRSLRDQQRKLAVLESRGSEATDDNDVDEGPLTGLRYSARSVRAQRRRLGLSAEDYGKLVGVSGLTIYNWEHGRTRPRAAQFEALAKVRGITKTQAAERLGIAAPSRSGRKPR